MSWENILKTEKVWVLSEEDNYGSRPIAVFKSEEALNQYLLKEHGENWPNRKNMTEEDILNDIFMTYDYGVDKVGLKG